eukprot:m.282199 g.282199  ORF g.282199 m.282199 type:complete len:93 (-) comp54937_c3_seq17:159-437(-)
MPLAQLLFWCGSTDHERLAAQQNIKPALRGPVLDNFTVGEEIRETVPIVLLEQPEAIAEEEFGMVSVSVESKSVCRALLVKVSCYYRVQLDL